MMRALEKLDDRISQAHDRDSERELGRLEGFARGMEYVQWLRGDLKECPPEFDRTHHKRLQKHLERQYRRMARGPNNR